MPKRLLELNSRVWLKELNTKFNKSLSLIEVPESVWRNFRKEGYDWIWLMGVWETSPVETDLHTREDLVNELNHSLPSWTTKDTVGSPYSILRYTINPLLGKEGDLSDLHDKLNKHGLNLMLDFVPNHYGSHTPLIETNLELFIHTTNKPTKNIELFHNINENWVAYGKDPYFPPWKDTFQLNYFNEDTRKFMTHQITQIAKVCDGIRCDMAMLCLNDVVMKTWGLFLEKLGFSEPQMEFWKEAIEMVKMENSSFHFLAEVYWDLEWTLQQLGFDYTYDKQLYDRMRSKTSGEITEHLKADLKFQMRSLRFIENHDEPRAVSAFGREKSLAAAAIISTIPGMTLYHQGQLEGKTIKTPLRLLQTKNEAIDTVLEKAYQKILTFSGDEVFRTGSFQLNPIVHAWEKNLTYQNLLSWQWVAPRNNQFKVIIVNYADTPSQGKIHLTIPEFFEQTDIFNFKDSFSGVNYQWEKNIVIQEGLFVDLRPFSAHLFDVE
ncbi:MAG: alpha-amylase family glycosyl hydrolase [Candidatus Hodarchaeales archaeon]|jgi:hypothetical protein